MALRAGVARSGAAEAAVALVLLALELVAVVEDIVRAGAFSQQTVDAFGHGLLSLRYEVDGLIV